jgi:hypothetical protein
MEVLYFTFRAATGFFLSGGSLKIDATRHRSQSPSEDIILVKATFLRPQAASSTIKIVAAKCFVTAHRGIQDADEAPIARPFAYRSPAVVDDAQNSSGEEQLIVPKPRLP